MLYIIGFGVAGSRGLTLQGINTIKKCDIVLIEKYTSVLDWERFRNEVQKITGKNADFVERDYVEDGNALVDMAKQKNVCLLVSGDPMIATTHGSLVSRVNTKIIHSNSILSVAISESGLHMYKFGRTVTLAQWFKNYKPVTTYDVVHENFSQGLHSLILMDIIHETGQGLSIEQGLHILNMMEKQCNKKMFTAKTKLIVMSRLGYDDQKITYASIAQLHKINPGKPPFVLILPGKLHFTEKDALKMFEK